MKRLTVCSTALIVVSSAATPADFPAKKSPVAPPVSDITFEVGAKYDFTKHSTKLKSHHNQLNGGETSATLGWNSIYSHGIEINGKISSQTLGVYSKGAVKINKSSNKSGEMRDTDYVSSTGVTFADSTSSAELSKGTKFNLNVGKDFYFDKIKFSPFVGWYYSKARMEAFGLTWLPVGDPSYYAANNLTLGNFVSNSVRDMTYETIINAPRFGASFNIPVSDRIALNFEPVLMPFAGIRLNDWHHLTPDKVHDDIPNLISKKTGIGYSADVSVSYKIHNNMNFELGLNFSEFVMKNADTTNRMVSGTTFMRDNVKELKISDMGITSGIKYKF